MECSKAIKKWEATETWEESSSPLITYMAHQDTSKENAGALEGQKNQDKRGKDFLKGRIFKKYYH